MTEHRVRTLIKHLNYGNLSKEKKLPKKPLFTQIKRGGVFPPIAAKMGYAQFGLFIDYYIRALLSRIYKLKTELDEGNYYSIYLHCNREEEVLEKESFNSSKKYLRDIGTFILKTFDKPKNIQLEPEWKFQNISGHPDLVIDDTVYDIKTTGHFSTMRIHTILQILSYYCLAQLLGKPITKIGLVLPAQSMCIVADMKGWNWKGFWEELRLTIDTKIKLLPSVSNRIVFTTMIYPHIGTHVGKNKTIHKTLSDLPSTQPFQLFFGGRANSKLTITENDIRTTSELIEKTNHRFYVHAPYTINLSRKYDDNWVVDTMNKYLSTAERMKSKGVVVHCGVKAKDVEHETAYKNMFDSVVAISESATEKCPLLIETSAGETGELLSNPSELIAFYCSLPDHVQKKVNICVDTCHVFAAGFTPIDFIRELEENKVPISLIHFNDSKGDKGCCKDRHEQVGFGYLGLGGMIPVGMYAIGKGIDLVVE